MRVSHVPHGHALATLRYDLQYGVYMMFTYGTTCVYGAVQS
jgi:hypothetical protein